MVLNLYYPAVSQIYNLTFLLSISIVFNLKSIPFHINSILPIVVKWLLVKEFSQNLINRHVLPTPESPMINSFI